MVSQLLILLLLGAASQHGLGQEVAGLFASERLIGDKPVIDPLAVQYRAALQFAVHELAQCTEGSTRSYCALPLHLPANSSAVFPPPDETGNPLDMAKSVLRGSSVASPQVAVGTPNACLRTIAAAIMNTTLPFFQLPGIPESTLPDLQSPSLSGSMQQELMALHTVMTAATVHLVDLIVSDDMARVADEFRDFASAHSDPVVNRTILLRAGSGIQPSDRTRILDMVFPSEEPATPSPLENEEKYPSIVVLFVSEALAADVLELIAGRGTLGEHEVHLYTTVDVLRLLPSYGLAPVKIFSLRSTVSQFSDPVRAARPARAFAGTFLDYWTSLLKPGLDVRNRGSSVEPQPLAIDSQSPSELGDWYSDLMQLYGGTPPGIIVPGELFGVAPKIPGVTSEEIEEAHRANDFLYARTGREFVIDTRVTFALDTALTIAAVLQQLNDSSSPGLIGGVRFEGTSGFVAFHDDGSRVNPSFQVLVSPPLSNGTSILVGVVEFGEDGSSRELQKTQAWFSLAQANQPWFNSTCDVFPSANDDQPCPRCDNALIIPIVVGVIAFLAAVIFILYCGRQRVGAQLFEQTALAEQEAKVAMQEAAVKSSFLANMSHEIRTPLHAILSMSRMLMDSREKDPNASPQDLEDLSQIIKSSETLQALVNDILFISKMQTASFELGNRTMDVCELLEDITQLLALRWSGKNVECQTLLRVPEFYFEIYADPLRLRQVLTNLATNSMKFTDEGSVILAVELVELHPNDDYAAEDGLTVPHLLFRVIDTGIGMDENTMFSLFQRFYQGNRTMKRMVGGAGLGLAISAELVSIMGGTIGVWSSGVNRGSEFWFTLPVQYRRPKGDPKRNNPQDLGVLETSVDSYPATSQATVKNVARVAYERSSEYVLSKLTPDFAQDLKATADSVLGRETALLICPASGVLGVCSQYLKRWGLRHYTGDDFDAAEQALVDAGSNVDNVSMIIMYIDEEDSGIPEELLARDNIRFVFICSESHGRQRGGGKPLWYHQCSNYTLLHKPVKRRPLWKALISSGQVQESPTLKAVERTMQDFSFRRRERPVFMNSPDAKASTKSRKSGNIKVMALPPPPTPAMPSFNFKKKPAVDEPTAQEADVETKLTILMAEDNLVNIKIARRFIEWAGYQVDVVMDGQQCIDKVKESPPYALILMDCQMPNVDGYQATKAIRAWEKQQVMESGTQRRETPIVAMTAYTMPEDQEKCLDEGMNDYISKPFTKEVLRDTIQRWINTEDTTEFVHENEV